MIGSVLGNIVEPALLGAAGRSVGARRAAVHRLLGLGVGADRYDPVGAGDSRSQDHVRAQRATQVAGGPPRSQTQASADVEVACEPRAASSPCWSAGAGGHLRVQCCDLPRTQLMALTAGTRLGAYEVTSLLGEGSMAAGYTQA